MNKGEISEIVLKAFLLKMKDTNNQDTIFGKITELSDDGNLSELTWKSEAELSLKSFDVTQLMKESVLGIGKASSSSKADISINNIQYSLKEKGGANVAIVNHTPRHGFQTACDIVSSDITTLDNIITEYWKLRLKGIIKQDTKTLDKNCPFSNHKDYLKPIIEYFLFTGTGRGESNFPAEKMMEINYKELPNKIKIFERDEYYDQVWNKLVFSVRSKGMPPNYPNVDNESSISKWTHKVEEKHKGSLHIRVG